MHLQLFFKVAYLLHSKVVLINLSLVVVIGANWSLMPIGSFSGRLLVSLSLALVSPVFGSCGVIIVN